MASITFTTDTEALMQLTAAACSVYNYQAMLPDPDNPGKFLPNPVGPAEFATNVIISFCKEVVKTYQVQQAVKAAQAKAAAGADEYLNSVKIEVATA